MSDTAYMIRYRQESIAGFEQQQSLLRETCVTEAMIDGQQAVFLVAGSGGNRATTRGVDGRIPGRANDLTQVTATLTEKHDVRELTRFNIFASQGKQDAIMQRVSRAVINREIDIEILAELQTGTLTWGAAQTASLALVMAALAKLGYGSVPLDGNVNGVISPGFHAYLAQTKEFASVEYVSGRPSDGNDLAWKDRTMNYRWQGVNWIVHPNIVGKQTADEKCFMYHRDAIGHAMNSEGLDVNLGYDGRHDFSWARTTVFTGPKLLQNSGIIEMTHDGLAFV